MVKLGRWNADGVLEVILAAIAKRPRLSTAAASERGLEPRPMSRAYQAISPGPSGRAAHGLEQHPNEQRLVGAERYVSVRNRGAARSPVDHGSPDR